MRVLDSVALARLKNMRLKLGRHLSEGHFSGRHRSMRRGFSQEFAEHRAYAQGDELKRIDWKVFARKERLFVKEFQEEKTVRSFVFLDASGSMAYQGSGPETKWRFGARLAAAMGYLVLSQGDSAGLSLFDSRPRQVVSPRRGLAHLETFDSILAETRPAGEGDWAAAVDACAARLPRRSMIVLVSDLLGDYRRILETVRALAARRHRMLVLQVLDPTERDLDLEGPVLFESLENAESLRCETALVRKAYKELFELQQRSYEVSFRQAGVFYDVFYTDQPWDKGLTRFLGMQG